MAGTSERRDVLCCCLFSPVVLPRPWHRWIYHGWHRLLLARRRQRGDGRGQVRVTSVLHRRHPPGVPGGQVYHRYDYLSKCVEVNLFHPIFNFLIINIYGHYVSFLIFQVRFEHSSNINSSCWNWTGQNKGTKSRLNIQEAKAKLIILDQFTTTATKSEPVGNMKYSHPVFSVPTRTLISAYPCFTNYKTKVQNLKIYFLNCFSIAKETKLTR